LSRRVLSEFLITGFFSVRAFIYFEYGLREVVFS
jgi:hypothetical protein